jgi:DNA-binding IclR family transcriptional regulator
MADPKRIGCVEWALDLLEVLGRSSKTMSFTDIVERVGRPKSSVHRMLSTLLSRGFVERVEQTGRYRLGAKLWGLGVTALGDRNLSSVARPHLRKLMLATEETVNLAILLGDEMSIMYLDKVDGPRMINVNSPIGMVSPAWCTATGRSMLAHRPQSWGRVLSGPFRKLTPNTTTDPKRLRAILERSASDGYAVTLGERSIERGGVAAPIRDHSGEVVAACGLAIPAFRMNKALVNRVAPSVMETASEISRALGWAASGLELGVKKKRLLQAAHGRP